MNLKTKSSRLITEHLNKVFKMLENEDTSTIQCYILDHLLEEEDEQSSEIVFDCFWDENKDQ